MVTEIEFRVDADSFALGSVFHHEPGVTIELQRIVPTATSIVPYFWIHHIDEAELDAAFATHDGITNVERVDSVGDDHLYRAEWEADEDSLLRSLVDSNAVVVSGLGTKDNWTFEVRLDDRDDVKPLFDTLMESGVETEILNLHQLYPDQQAIESELTEDQEEALELALHRGYFETPQRTTLKELAAELGITRQSLSSRIHRGIRNILTRRFDEYDTEGRT